MWRFVQKLLRQHYPDKFIEGRMEKDTWIRSTDPKQTNKPNKQTN